jgi:hypothetical protein
VSARGNVCLALARSSFTYTGMLASGPTGVGSSNARTSRRRLATDLPKGRAAGCVGRRPATGDNRFSGARVLGSACLCVCVCVCVAFSKPSSGRVDGLAPEPPRRREGEHLEAPRANLLRPHCLSEATCTCLYLPYGTCASRRVPNEAARVARPVRDRYSTSRVAGACAVASAIAIFRR